MKTVKILLLTLAFSSVTAHANTTALQQLPAKLDQLVTDGVMPGSITYIVQNGETVFHHINGYQDLASKTAMTEDTLFRWYSMSKPITSVAIMMLHEQGYGLLQLGFDLLRAFQVLLRLGQDGALDLERPEVRLAARMELRLDLGKQSGRIIRKPPQGRAAQFGVDTAQL